MVGVFGDWKRNRHNIKGRLVMAAFRLAGFSKLNWAIFVIFIPYLIIYRVFIEWILAVELPFKTKVGKGLILYHGQSTVINDGTVIGENCTIRHCTTIGNKQNQDGSYSSCPVIGNYVDVGSNVCIIGPVKIGNNVKIGAGSVVIKNVPDNVIVAGNPARIIKTILE